MGCADREHGTDESDEEQEKVEESQFNDWLVCGLKLLPPSPPRGRGFSLGTLTGALDSIV